MEHDILMLLSRSPGTRFSYKEVGRVIDRRQFREDCHWARPVLERLVNEKAIEKEDSLYYFQDRQEANEHANRTERAARTGGSSSSGAPATVTLKDETDKMPIKPLGAR